MTSGVVTSDVPGCEDGHGECTEVPHGGWRHTVRCKPGLRQAYRMGVFASGLLFVAAGGALVALPGPLTIPPLLVGLWIWSTEFRFAERFFDALKGKGQEAWAHFEKHPVTSTLVTVGGLALAAAGFWAVSHFGLSRPGARGPVLRGAISSRSGVGPSLAWQSGMAPISIGT